MADPSSILKTLGDPTRLKIVAFLAHPVESCCRREDGVCGCDLETYLGLTQPTVSHHMKQLVDAGVVRAQRRGRWVYYELEANTLRDVAALLEELAGAADARTDEVAA